jgi:hypothetical protein
MIKQLSFTFFDSFYSPKAFQVRLPAIGNDTMRGQGVPAITVNFFLVIRHPSL